MKRRCGNAEQRRSDLAYEICGNKVEMVAAGKGTLHCCGQPMKLAGEKK
jgi:desulfoferrodoxin-like iron-binding protein